MLRQALIAASKSATMRRLVTQLPATRAVAHRFVAGERLDQAVAVARALNATGASVSLDYLGESVRDAAGATQAADMYGRTLRRIADESLDGSISVKLTQLGLDVDPVLCRDLVGDICALAADVGTDVTVDMEGSAHTQATVDLVLALRAQGNGNVGCAVQAYLHRTPEDVGKLNAAGASLRLCKGAYAEPPEIAYQRKRDVDAAYARLTGMLFTQGTYPRLATHDHRLIHLARNLARRLGVGPDRFEFQMLYGVREPLQRDLLAQGHRVRVYVPFGDQWYPYLMRRLAERPANLAFFLRALAGARG